MTLIVNKRKLLTTAVILILTSIIAYTLFKLIVGNMEQKQSISMGEVEIYVKDINNIKTFYSDLIGLEVIKEDAITLELGYDSKTLVKLHERTDFTYPGQSEAGLYHTALVFESQNHLANTLLKILEKSPNLYQGSADHVATEAFYLSDPEGNGIELYYDKPKNQWKYDSNGNPVMGSTYIPEDQYIQDHAKTSEKQGIKMGHVHLKVGSITETKGFYTKVLQFEVMNEMSSALFVSRDKYHHHIGMNTWESDGSNSKADKTYGLKGYTITVHDKKLYKKIRTESENRNLISNDMEDSFQIMDPWGIEIIITSKVVDTDVESSNDSDK